MDWSVPSLELATKTNLDPWECGEVTLDTEKCDPCYLKLITVLLENRVPLVTILLRE